MYDDILLTPQQAALIEKHKHKRIAMKTGGEVVYVRVHHSGGGWYVELLGRGRVRPVLARGEFVQTERGAVIRPAAPHVEMTAGLIYAEVGVWFTRSGVPFERPVRRSSSPFMTAAEREIAFAPDTRLGESMARIRAVFGKARS